MRGQKNQLKMALHKVVKPLKAAQRPLRLNDLTFDEAMGFPDRGTPEDQQSYLRKCAEGRARSKR